MITHTFTALHSSDSVADYVTAACSCGWTGAYTHAFERYARPDWVQHVRYETLVAEMRRDDP